MIERKQKEKYGKDLPAGRISYEERQMILEELGNIAKEKYDEYIVQGGKVLGYDLKKLEGFLQFEADVFNFQNIYYLEGDDDKWTDIAYYFEYGTGLHNTNRAGKYRAGYIKPVHGDYMMFLSKKFGRWVKTDRIQGVRPVFALLKTIKFIENYNKKEIRKYLREEELI